jgi:hypothetical protein
VESQTARLDALQEVEVQNSEHLISREIVQPHAAQVLTETLDPESDSVAPTASIDSSHNQICASSDKAKSDGGEVRSFGCFGILEEKILLKSLYNEIMAKAEEDCLKSISDDIQSQMLARNDHGRSNHWPVPVRWRDEIKNIEVCDYKHDGVWLDPFSFDIQLSPPVEQMPCRGPSDIMFSRLYYFRKWNENNPDNFRRIFAEPFYQTYNMRVEYMITRSKHDNAAEGVRITGSRVFFQKLDAFLSEMEAEADSGTTRQRVLDLASHKDVTNVNSSITSNKIESAEAESVSSVEDEKTNPRHSEAYQCYQHFKTKF